MHLKRSAIVFVLHSSCVTVSRWPAADQQQQVPQNNHFDKPDFFSADSQQQTVTTEAFHQEMLQMAQKKKNPEMHQNFLVALMSSLVAVSFHYIS